MLTRFELVIILRIQVSDRTVLREVFAIEAVMEELAARLAPHDVSTWSMTALGAGLDRQLCAQNPAQRGIVAREILLTEGATAEIADAVLAAEKDDVQDLPILSCALLAATAGARAVLAAVQEEGRLNDVDDDAVANAFSPDDVRRVLDAMERLGVTVTEIASAARRGAVRVREDLRL